MNDLAREINGILDEAKKVKARIPSTDKMEAALGDLWNVAFRTDTPPSRGAVELLIQMRDYLKKVPALKGLGIDRNLDQAISKRDIDPVGEYVPKGIDMIEPAVRETKVALRMLDQANTEEEVLHWFGPLLAKVATLMRLLWGARVEEPIAAAYEVVEKARKGADEAEEIPDWLGAMLPKELNRLPGEIGTKLDWDIYSAYAFCVLLLEDVNAHSEAKAVNELLKKFAKEQAA